MVQRPAGGAQVSVNPLGPQFVPNSTQGLEDNAVRSIIAVLLLLGSVAMAKADVLTAVTQRDHQTLSALLEAGSNPDQRNGEGQTALLVAVWENDVAAARLLLAAGADVNAKDSINDSPFLLAGARGRLDILKLILEHGPDLEARNRFGGTALIPAAERGHLETVQVLLAAGVDPNHINNLGWTALMEAVILGDGSEVYQRIVTALLEGGSDPAIPDGNGVTAHEHATERGYDAIAALLTP
ncbi:ankyrin repeat protein [Devosia sp. 2618]